MPEKEIVAQLAPTGVLRAGINLSNMLLVTGKSANGDPEGVSPDMAAAVAAALGVTVKYVPFQTPGELADAAGANRWDIGNIGAEPQRAAEIEFTAAYCEIEASYLVWSGSPLKTVADVDAPGVRIVTAGRAAYGLWLERNIKRATLVRTDTVPGAAEQFARDKIEAMAGLRPRLLTDVQEISGTRILDGKFMSVQQAIGTPKKNQAGAAWLRGFVEEAKASGLVARLIAKHKVQGLSVAPKA
ncbi:MAG TPA: transporter substrate-binding domain-containing protein [Stellaceae bacterium]|nr:transporter substrate-binding domain-containing protein [Stellaceae bacterium]